MNWSKYAIKESFYLGVSSVIYPLYFADLEHTQPLEGSEFLTADNQQGFVNKYPVLLIHGYFHNHSAWLYLKKCLMNAGIGPIYTINFNGKFKKIQQYAQQLSEKIEQIRGDFGDEEPFKVNLVGHSMGGIVAAFFAEFLDSSDDDGYGGIVDKIITIGSPLEGTKVANKIGIGECAKEMQYQSDFSTILHNAIAENCKKIDYHHIYGAHDQLVIPQTSGRIKSNKFYKLEHEGHISLLFSKIVSDILLNIILK